MTLPPQGFMSQWEHYGHHELWSFMETTSLSPRKPIPGSPSLTKKDNFSRDPRRSLLVSMRYQAGPVRADLRVRMRESFTMVCKELVVYNASKILPLALFVRDSERCPLACVTYLLGTLAHFQGLETLHT